MATVKKAPVVKEDVKKETVKPVAKAEAKPVAKAEVKPAAKTEVKAEVKPAAKAEAKPAAKKAEIKAPAKKAAAKKAEIKAPAKKAAAKKAPAKKAEVKESISIQFGGKDYTTEDLVKIAKDVWKYDLNKKVSDFQSVELYVKPEESMVYYVINGDVTGSFAI